MHTVYLGRMYGDVRMHAKVCTCMSMYVCMQRCVRVCLCMYNYVNRQL